MSSRELKFTENTAKTASLFKMAAKQAMKENLQCTSKYGHLRISQDICHVRMTDIEGFLTIYGHSDNLLNNKVAYVSYMYTESLNPYCFIMSSSADHHLKTGTQLHVNI